MARLWLIIYNICVVPSMWIGFHIGALFNDKIQRGLDGRKNLLNKVRAKLATRKNPQTLWIHAASLGEFEQAKPIIEVVKERYPSVFIFVTFFSPSGMDYALEYIPGDAVAYLPFDSFFAAKKFVDLLRPSAAIFIRYELWLNHLHALHARGIPAMLACASGRNLQKKNLLVRSYNAAACQNFGHILCVEDSDAAAYTNMLDESLNKKTAVTVVGDTKFDRVTQRAKKEKANVLPDQITRNKFIVVAGSTWKEDEKIIAPVINKLMNEYHNTFLYIVAPHEPTETHLQSIESQMPSFRLSEIDSIEGEKNEGNVIIVDSVGQLFSLYQYADVAFVGGGFHRGVHNVLEPAAFGIPVLCGPNIGNAREAQELLESGGGHIINSSEGFHSYLIRAINDPAFIEDEGRRAYAFTQSHTGAANKIVDSLTDILYTDKPIFSINNHNIVLS